MIAETDVQRQMDVWDLDIRNGRAQEAVAAWDVQAKATVVSFGPQHVRLIRTAIVSTTMR
jgi:hypothetical protein